MTVLADASEERDGKGSVLGIFQAVTARRFPTTHTGVLVLRFSLEDAEDAEVDGLILDTRLIGPDDQELAALQPLRGIDVTVDLQGTLLPTPGLYRFEVWAKETLQAVVPLSAWPSD